MLRDGQGQVRELDRLFHVGLLIEHDAKPGNLSFCFLSEVIGAEVGFELVQRINQPSELAVRYFQHGSQGVELTPDKRRHLQLRFVGQVVANVRPSVFEQGANLNLGFQAEDFRWDFPLGLRAKDVLRDWRLQPGGVDGHDVMHRAIAKLSEFQALANVFAVRPVNVKGFFNELTYRPNLVVRVHNHARPAQIRHQV